MPTQLFDNSIIGTSEQALDFIGNILESSTEYSIVGKDLDGKILLWNEGARRLYGYEPEEVVGKANSSILHVPEDVQSGRHREIMDTAQRDGKWEGTLNRIRKNGQRFTARVVITPRRDATSKAIGYLLISKDISDEIRLMEELKATQFYTRSLIESNIDALMTTDPVGVISDVNQQMELLTSYTREELIGTAFKKYFTDPQRAEEGIRLVLREGNVINYELTALSKSGKMTIVSYNASTFRDSGGKLQGVFAAARHHRAEGAGNAAARIAGLQPRPHRGVRGRPHHGGSRRPDLGRERAAVAHVRLFPRGAHRHALRRLLRGQRGRDGRHERDVPKGRCHRLRAHAGQGRRQGGARVVQRVGVQRPVRRSARHLRQRATSPSRPACKPSSPTSAPTTAASLKHRSMASSPWTR
ncbi:PAS domain S-box protein [Polaromonas sp. P2-4]|nr:PAS domain S-box protein [Polaromonas sp. P2-4]